MTPKLVSQRIPASYFDGQSGAAHEVLLWREGDMLQIAGKTLWRQVSLTQVQWPERTRHGPRLALLPGGGSVQALDTAQWDSWMTQAGTGDPLVVRAQQSWRWVVLATLLLVALCLSAYRWALPLASQALARLIPPSVEQQLGATALEALEGHLLSPSHLGAAPQETIRAHFAHAMRRRFASGEAPQLTLQFRQSRIGPNAFALPGGTIIVTDELVDLLSDRPDVLLGVLGHEAGHLRMQHGTRGLLQASVLGTVMALVLGDVGSLLGTAPVVLGQMAYSRDFEREADNEAIAWLRANGVRPAVMKTLFERLGSAETTQDDHGELAQALGIAFRSHPATAERIQRFLDADQAGGEADARRATALP